MDILTHLGYLWKLTRKKITTQTSTKTRVKSNLVSRHLRKIFEHKPLRTLFGLSLAVFTLTIGLASPEPALTDNSQPVLEIVSLSPQAISFTTTESIRYPTDDKELEINQYFHSWHPGLDIDGQIGKPVYPIIKGKVISVQRQRYAYGNHIIIDHGLGLSSLYGHLNEINVETDQQVTTKTIIGKMGSTGQSTGPHLHLEIIDQGRYINPMSLLNP